MATIREAVSADRAAIVRMGREFHAAANAPIAFDVAYAAAVVASYTADADKLCLVLDDGTIVGALLAQAMQSPIGPYTCAMEIMWWIEPCARGLSAVRMIAAYEKWARTKGCAIVGLAALAGGMRPAALYERLGYARAETHFMKRL